MCVFEQRGNFLDNTSWVNPCISNLRKEKKSQKGKEKSHKKNKEEQEEQSLSSIQLNLFPTGSTLKVFIFYVNNKPQFSILP